MEKVASSSDHSKKLFLVGLTLALAWVVLTFVPVTWDGKTPRYLSDPFDRLVYFERGHWFFNHTPAISEYPQIPSYLFGITNLASMGFDERVQAQVYAAFFSFEMLVVLFLTMRLLFKLLPSSASNRVLFMLLPPALYFAYNRFDILPAFFCVAAFYYASNRRWGAVAVLLSLATFTKWYPILLLPGFFFYARRQERKFPWEMPLLFTGTSVLIILPTLLQGGWSALLHPYLLHGARGMEFAALPVLLSSGLLALFNITINNTIFFALFFVLQLSGPFVSLFPRIDSLDTLADYCIVTTGFFILFSRIYSPQWMLWLLPFLVLSAKDRADRLLIVFYACTSYLGFPVIYDLYGGNSFQLRIAAAFMFLSLALILARKIRSLIESTWFRP